MSRSIASTTTNRQKYKIVFLGDQGAGKTSIINRFVEDNFDDNSGVVISIFLAYSWNRFYGQKYHT